MKTAKSNLFLAFLLLIISARAQAQTSLTGSSLALKSSGSATMSSAGYVGTYVTIPAGGATVNFTINATEGSGSGSNPHMNFVIADTNVGININSTSATNYSSGNITLPAGTYFVSNQRDYPDNVGVSRSLTVNNISVNTVSGSTATFSNTSTDANAFAASDTYINNFRKGQATVKLSGPNNIPLLAGTPITANLARSAFNWGNAVPGSSSSSVNAYMGSSSTAQQTNYQSHLNQNFNAVTEENAGKWGNDESTQNVVTMGGVDTILNYAQTNQMRARAHNLIWGNSNTTDSQQQPAFVNTLLASAGAGNATSKASLTTAINNRISYFVGSGTSSDRDLKYQSIDVYNESYHTGQAASSTNNYWSVYGASGIAGIYNQVAAQITASGSSAKVYTNEYNVLQNNGTSYSTFYVGNIDQIRDAGGTVGGIGVQYYPSAVIGSADNSHSPARIESSLQSLDAQGLPLTLTEFGVASGGSTATAATILQDTMRLMFGNPQSNGMFMWGFQAENGGSNLFASSAALYTVNTSNWSNWTITAAGEAWQDQLGIQDWDGNPNDGWTTNFTANLDSTGSFSFPVTSDPTTSGGFYGDYYLSGEQPNSLNAKILPFDFTLNKGTTNYNQTVAKPTNWFFWMTNTSGTWSTAANWTDAPQSGTVPNTAGYTTYFGSSATVYNLTTGAPTTTNITAPVTVNLSSPVTMGMLVFDSANSYTLSGSTITLQGYNNANGHVAGIYVNAGSHTINSALTLLDNTTVTVVPVASTLTTNGIQSTTATLTKSGAGSMTLTGTSSIGSSVAVTAGALTLSSGSLATPSITVGSNSSFHYDGGALSATNLTVHGGLAAMAAASGDRVMQLNSLTLDGIMDGWSGKVNLNDNDMVVFNGNIINIANQLKSGHTGNWTGSAGILSTVAANDSTHLTTLGYRQSDGSDFDSVHTTTADVEVKYTYFGDADLNGVVDGADYQQIDNGFGQKLTGWYNGDFNYDGVVDGTDYSLIDNTFNQLSTGNAIPLALVAGAVNSISSTSSVPEPAALAFFVIAALGIARRR